MKARLISKKDTLYLLSENGKMCVADEKILGRLFVYWSNIDSFIKGDDRWDDVVDRIEDYQGLTLAYINDDFHLCLIQNPFVSITPNVTEEEYITLQEYADIQGKNSSRIKVLCRENRIPGAIKKAGKWFIPKNAKYPQDARYAGVEK